MARRGGRAARRAAAAAAAPGRWHWDTPLVISPHAARRIYVAGERVYRSDDRGDNWVAISADLTRNLDPAEIPIMGKVWPRDSVAFNQATTQLSTITALDESPLLEGLIYIGTHRRPGAGHGGWRQELDEDREAARACPSTPSSPMSFASPRDANTVFATFNNYQRGDFKPYVYKSADRGRTWTSIAGNLPQRSGAWAIVQDHVNGNLLFAGMEFGVWFTRRRRRGNGRSSRAASRRRRRAICRFSGARPTSSSARSAAALTSSTTTRRSAAMTAQALTEEARLFPLRDAYIFDELSHHDGGVGQRVDARTRRTARCSPTTSARRPPPMRSSC